MSKLYNDHQRIAIIDSMTRLRDDLDSGGQHGYTPYGGSRLISVEATVLRYMIERMKLPPREP